MQLPNLYLGLDVGRTIRGAVLGEDGIILTQRRVVAEVRNPRVFIDQLIGIANDLKSSSEADGRVIGAGIGWAGLVNQRAQRIEVTPNLVDLSQFDLLSELKQG